MRINRATVVDVSSFSAHESLHVYPFFAGPGTTSDSGDEPLIRSLTTASTIRIQSRTLLSLGSEYTAEDPDTESLPRASTLLRVIAARRSTEPIHGNAAVTRVTTRPISTTIRVPHILLPSTDDWNYSDVDEPGSMIRWDEIATAEPNQCGMDEQSPVNIDLEAVQPWVGEGSDGRGGRRVRTDRVTHEPVRVSAEEIGHAWEDLLSQKAHPLTLQLQRFARVQIVNTGHDIVVTPLPVLATARGLTDASLASHAAALGERAVGGDGIVVGDENAETADVDEETKAEPENTPPAREKPKDTSRPMLVNLLSGAPLPPGAVYSLSSFHFHAPSEHTVERHHSLLELHLVRRGTRIASFVASLLLRNTIFILIACPLTHLRVAYRIWFRFPLGLRTGERHREELEQQHRPARPGINDPCRQRVFHSLN